MFKGSYTPVRIVQIFTNAAVLFSMLGLMISGVILSREVFAFLPISGGVAFARSLHVISAFWGFFLTAFHLGLHWNLVIGMVKNTAGTVPPKPVRFLLRMAAVLIAGYGVYAISLDRIINTSGNSMLTFRPLSPGLDAEMRIIWKKYQTFSRHAEKFLQVLTEQG